MDQSIMVEVSARHVHVTREVLDVLFGKGYELTKKKDLSQPGQFASNERVTVVGPKKEQKNVSILGPIRPYTQVELSLTDTRSLGFDAPVRESGDIDKTPGCKLVGPCGEVEIKEGVIVAKRHIHMTPDDAAALGVQNGQIVAVKIDTAGRGLTFGEVVVRVNENFRLAMHIDTDEGNAVLAGPDATGVLVK